MEKKISPEETAEVLVGDILEDENIIRVYLFPDDKTARMLYITEEGYPLEWEECIAPFYFKPDELCGIGWSGVAHVHPCDEGVGKLPLRWGCWSDAKIIYDAASRTSTSNS